MSTCISTGPKVSKVSTILTMIKTDVNPIANPAFIRRK